MPELTKLQFSRLPRWAGPPAATSLVVFAALQLVHVMPPVQYRALHRGTSMTTSGMQTLRRFAATLAAPPSEW